MIFAVLSRDLTNAVDYRRSPSTAVDARRRQSTAGWAQQSSIARFP